MFFQRRKEWHKGQKFLNPLSEFLLPMLQYLADPTLIGTASNLIVSTYRLNAFGEPFKMFDFSIHGLAMLLSGTFVLLMSSVFGLLPIVKVKSNNGDCQAEMEIPTEDAVPRDRRKSIIVLIVLIPGIIFTGIGLIHPSIAFGFVTLIMIYSNVLPYKIALSNINIPIIIFLGSMFGISGILEETGALKSAVSIISPFFTSLFHLFYLS